MTTEYIRYRIAEGDREEFEAAYGRAAVPLTGAKECVDYELSRCAEDPGAYVLRITWTSARDHLEGFRSGPAFAAFFAEIKPYVSAIEEMRHYEPTGVAGRGGAVPTLYEWAGGADALARLFDTFYRHGRDDDVLAPVFAGMSAEHPRRVAAWLGEVFGGPADYSAAHGGPGGHGGHPHMIMRHRGRALTETQRRRWVSLLVDTADEVGLPDDPEFRASFVGYLEWGTRLAVLLSQPGAPAPADSPMPSWHWALPPYRP